MLEPEKAPREVLFLPYEYLEVNEERVAFSIQRSARKRSAVSAEAISDQLEDAA